MSLMSSIEPAKRKTLLTSICVFAVIALIGLGVMAANGWLPRTDAMSGEKTGWFRKKLPKTAGSTWNPLAAPLPTATPQLSKEYIYAGSRLLAVEDVNANAVPPADIAVWRPSSGYWYVLGGPGSAQTSYQWGLGAWSDTPVLADFDGDGKTDFCVVRLAELAWYYVLSSNGSPEGFYFGGVGDIPTPADYDGDGKTDIALFRPSTGVWYVYQSTTLTTVSYTFGQSGDKLAPADYDGDGKADPAVWRYGTTSQFHVKRSSDGQTQTVNLGSASTDQPVSADFDGDGKADHALLAGNVWTIRSSITSSTSTTTWQNSGDIPVQNDYDGDGKVDIASWRASNGNWYIRNSHDSSTRTQQWGTSGDIPVPAYYRR